MKSVHPDARPTMTSRANLKDVVARMVRDEFLAREGYRRGLQNSEYVQEEVRRWKEDLVFNRMRKMLLDTVAVSEKEMDEFHAKNKSKYVEPARANIREIFVSDEDLAHELLTRIKAGENFAELAKKYSLRKWAAARGGEFGFFGVGMHGEVGEKALSMHGGQRAGPFEIDDPLYGKGFSIFEVTAKKERRYLTFEEARMRVGKDALMEKQGRILTEVLNQLRKEYEITINEERLAQIQTTDDIAKGRKVEMYAVPRF
ncbi:peptidyl-prolyl cis-trans isomerase [candidate division KSB1 bacterium]|nr:peptidyl-prolyl cis-trans isomerase [candidate division KSB1 bacterium]